ncbi:hypothetical protein EV182_007582, partial [Spiromyces aspiralis]
MASLNAKEKKKLAEKHAKILAELHFRRIGNRRANAFFNPRPERHPFNKNWTDRERERYIRDKYERRYFVDYGNGVPDPTTDNGEVPEDEE